jgi:predicted RecB family nuclease
MEEQLFALYKAEATSRQGDRPPVLTNFPDVTRAPLDTVHSVDCATTVYRFSGQASLHDGALDRSSTDTEGPIPVAFSPWDKPELIDSLLICFGAIALAQVSDIWVSAGMLIYGTRYRRKLVKTNQHLAQIYPVLERLRKAHEAGLAPPVVLNRHCSTCDFQSQCRQLAIDQDDLTLLRGMTEKERSKIRGKGISTITQLSYSYRPRRRKRKRSVDGILTNGSARSATIARNDQALRALAVKKQQAHIQGVPPLRIEGTPVVLDVEGMPDRDFCYLIGLRFNDGNKQVQRSFWANGPDGERDIWQQCLRMLEVINKPQIVSYGAYELRLLRRMKSRYGGADRYVEGLLATAINLIDCLYGKIYFLTYSNSLKGNRTVSRHRVGLATGFRERRSSDAPHLGTGR